MNGSPPDEDPPEVPEDDDLARLQGELEAAGRGRDVLAGDLPPPGPDPYPVPAEQLADPLRVRQVIEALLLVADRPLGAGDIARILGSPDIDAGEVRRRLAELAREYDERGAGMAIAEVAAGFQLRTRPEAAPWVRAFTGRRPVKLSRAALEVLAIVAYRQPCTRADLEGIRGVDSGAAVKSLMDRGLVRIIGRREEPGRPMTYGTTRLFLQVFALRNLADLPSLREFADLGPREEWEGPGALDAPPLGTLPQESHDG